MLITSPLSCSELYELSLRTHWLIANTSFRASSNGTTMLDLRYRRENVQPPAVTPQLRRDSAMPTCILSLTHFVLFVFLEISNATRCAINRIGHHLALSLRLAV